MKSSARNISFLTFILISMLLISCAPQKKDAFDQVVMQSQQQIVGGNYQKALDYYLVAIKKYPNDKNLEENYLITVKRVKQLADTAQEVENFVVAEKIYSVLLKNYSHFKMFDKSLSFSKRSLSDNLKNCKINRSEKQSRHYLDAGEFEKSLRIYRVIYREYPDDPVLLTNLINCILDIKFLAEIALEKEDFLSAGKIYYALLKNHKDLNKFYGSLSLPKEFLEEGLENCRSQLTKKGLEEYRKGNLAEAITIWKGILKFDPDNQQIKKAIETATAQLKNLRKKENQ